MATRALIIGAQEKQHIKKVMEYAEKNVLGNKADLELSPAMQDKYVCKIPFGFRVMFTIEEHPGNDRSAPPIKMRHINISVPSKNSYPNTKTCNMILRAFGFKQAMESEGVRIWTEANLAINIMERYV